MTDTLELEDIDIDKWQSKIPSEICTNKEIFNQVFSLNTWNNVLSVEQRERILVIYRFIDYILILNFVCACIYV